VKSWRVIVASAVVHNLVVVRTVVVAAVIVQLCCHYESLIAIKKIQLPNTLPIISILISWDKKAKFQLLITNY
jgi:hypothetical protein